MNKEAIKRVAKGAEWLDEVAPGWEGKLSFQELRMADGCHCVLGQVFLDQAVENQVIGYSSITRESAPNGFCWALESFGEFGEMNDEEFDFDDDIWPTRLLGFDYDLSNGVTYDDLHEAWIALVKNRYDTGTLSDAG